MAAENAKAKSRGIWNSSKDIWSVRPFMVGIQPVSFQGRNNYCKTDLDATFLHMKDDPMRNTQLKSGYNVQFGVESEYIMAMDIFQDRNDVWTLVLFLKSMSEFG